MKIKRYTADSMRAALALVRAEQGPDAVILSSRRNEEGIEVIAAIDYDDSLFASVQTKAPQPVAEPPIAKEPAIAKEPSIVKERPVAKEPDVERAPMTVRFLGQPQPVTVRTEPVHGAVQKELEEMRYLMETGISALTWNDKRLREPLQVGVLEALSSMNIEPDVALALAALTPERTAFVDPSQIPLALLCKYLPVMADDCCENGGVVMLVGPTGAGKTTTIAKLAARWCAQHGAQDLALISTDSHRSGAREQLGTYARNLGVAMYAADCGEQLARYLSQLSAKKLILVDTAGMGPRDKRLSEQLASLKFGAAQARVLLALPATGESEALDKIVRSYAPLSPVGSIVTKVDEAASLGAVLSVTLRHEMKIGYICDGQRMTDNLHPAIQTRMWLVRTAIQMKARNPSARNEAYLARNFGGASAHA